jgi:hypothetical protein
MNIKKSFSNLRINTLNDNEDERKRQNMNLLEKYKRENIEYERLNTDTIIEQEKISRKNNTNKINYFLGGNSQQAKNLSKKFSPTNKTNNNFNIENKIYLQNIQKGKIRIDSCNKIVSEVNENINDNNNYKINKNFSDEKNKVFNNVISSRRNPSLNNNNKNKTQNQQKSM